MKNKLMYGKKKHLETKMSPYSDDVYEEVPFTCQAHLKNEELHQRISAAIYKRFPPRHFAGCGYSCCVSKLTRETPVSGKVVLMHYHGIGD